MSTLRNLSYLLVVASLALAACTSYAGGSAASSSPPEAP